MKTLGIIPARGGSKGVKDKNIRIVAGEPLISYSINAAQNSKLLTHYLTTTDSEKIANIAREYGSYVLMRPDELARDETPMLPVVIHAIEHAEKRFQIRYDSIVILQPTAPIRKGEDIDAVIKILENKPEIEGVVSVCPMNEIHPARMYKVDKRGEMKSLWPEWETAQRQSLPVVYYRNGALYAVRCSILYEQNTLLPKKKAAYIMPVEHMVNIDDMRDLIIADVMVKMWKEGRL